VVQGRANHNLLGLRTLSHIQVYKRIFYSKKRSRSCSIWSKKGNFCTAKRYFSARADLQTFFNLTVIKSGGKGVFLEAWRH
jgi:hypothetical protein